MTESEVSRTRATERRMSSFAPPFFVAGTLIALLLLWLGTYHGNVLPIIYYTRADQPVLLLGVVAMAIGAIGLRRAPNAPASLPTSFGGTRLWICVLIVMALLLWWGTYVLMANYPLTRDEHMVIFDMAVFAKGHLAEPVSPFWRPYAVPLVPAFLLQPNDPAGFVSSYLPGNAALRLAFSYVADPALFNPLLAALGGLALFDVARRAFERDTGAVAVAMILYVTSTQMLVNAMTVYAMTPHLALNLIWLAAFLRGGRAGHTVAILLGAYACGLHQIVFHPLFVAPFILWRAAHGHWRIVTLYTVAYGTICLGWALYPALAAQQASFPGIPTGTSNFLKDRVLPLLIVRDPETLPLMGFNVARFVAWQNLALLPLLVAAWPAIRRDTGIAAPLAAGIALTVLLAGFVLPYQGHGWGYRYLHGLIGSCALLGGYGWLAFHRTIPHASRVFVCLTALTVAVTGPWLLFQTYRFAVPYVAIDRLIAVQRTELVLIDTYDAAAMIDQVRNLPDLSNRPIRISSRNLTADQLAALCERGAVTLFTRADMHAAGMARDVSAYSPTFEGLVDGVRRKYSGCFKEMAPGS